MLSQFSIRYIIEIACSVLSYKNLKRSMSSSNTDNIHETFIRQAIELSVSAVEHGNHPFGACLVSKDGEVLLTAENTCSVPKTDITRHAELNLISMATQKFGRDVLEQCTLYTSCEPCLMCTGAFRWSGIRNLIYALQNETLGVSTAQNSLDEAVSSFFNH